MKNYCVGCAYECLIDLERTGENIRRLRKSKEMSAEQIAECFDISLNSVYKWERGETLPTLDKVYALAWLFDVSLDELIVGNSFSLKADSDDQPVPFYDDGLITRLVNLLTFRFLSIFVLLWHDYLKIKIIIKGESAYETSCNCIKEWRSYEFLSALF